MGILELAKESKKHFAAGEFKDAARLFKQLKELDTSSTFVQTGDGTIHVVEKGEDGKDKTDKRTGELVTKALE